MKKMLKSSYITKDLSTRLYQIPVPIIGLTGGIATGKSTVADFFRRDGFAVIDADKLVKSIYQTQEALDFIALEFPSAILNGSIHFKTLRELAFGHPDSQLKIETFIYKRMPQAFLSAYQSFNSPDLVVYDVPLLFEKNLDRLIDQSLCVYAPREIQIERLMARDQISHELAGNIISKQMGIDEKKLKADWVIDNSDGVDRLELNYLEFIKKIIQ